VVRNGICCFAEGPPPPRCVSFNVYLDPDAVGLIFTIPTGAVPGGALYYHIDCGPAHKVGEVLCLSGGRFYTLTFCEPGNNPNTYSIQSISGAVTTEDIVTRADENCIKSIAVTGLDPNTVTWTVKYPAGADTLLDYLSCTNCLNPVFTPDSVTPPTIIYTVCGQLEGTYVCDGVPLIDCADLTVTTLPSIDVGFDTDISAICEGQIPTINAEITPTDLTYTYEWYNGPNGTGTLVSTSPNWQPTGEGTFSLVVTDTSSGIDCNQVIHNFTITYDTQGPTTLNVPPPLDIECNDPDAELTIATWLATATASDEDLSSIPVYNDYAPFVHSCGLIHTVSFWADDICGNRIELTSEINIVDTSIPVFTTQAQDGTSECSSGDPNLNAGYLAWLANHGGALATDECDNTLTWTDNTATATWNGNAADNAISVTFRATDECGNYAETTATYTITDTQPPTLTCPGNITESAALNNCSKILVAPTDPVMTDDCSTPTLSWTMSGATTNSGTGTVTGQTFNVGVTTVTYTATDEASNSVSCTFTVTIIDVTQPVLDIAGCSDVTESAAPDNCSKVPTTIPDPTYTDTCWPVGALTITWTMTGATTNSGSGSVVGQSFNVGVTTVIYTVTDPDSNTATCSFNVTIVDTTPPGLNLVGCTDITESAAPDNCSKVPTSLVDPAFTDVCWPLASLNLTWVMTGATTGSGTGSVVGQSFNVGITTVVYTVTRSSSRASASLAELA
jgi:hypothetical protein